MNATLIAAISAWLLAQLTKIVWGLAQYGRDDFTRLSWRLIWAGGMPSAHSAVVTALCLTICLQTGAQSPLAGLSLILALIVIYDRSRMYTIYRRFQQAYPQLQQRVQGDPVLKDLVGHRVSEILVGVLIGAGVGLVTSFWEVT